MSHFAVNLILKRDNATEKVIEELLAPFDENIQMPEYIKEDVSDEEKERFIQHYIKNENDKEMKFDEMYAIYGESWNGNSYKKINDKWVVISTYNPKSQWDWHKVGGRWSGWLQDREKELETDNGFNFHSSESINDNSTPVSLAIEKEKIPFAIITPDGEWIEKGKMGRWGMASNQKDKDMWSEEAINVYRKYNHEDYIVVCVDCHI